MPEKTATTKNARVFFALWPNVATRSRLFKISKQLPDNQGRLIGAENLHLTLCFIGEIDQMQLQVFTRAAEDVISEPFALALDRLGYFARTRVLWLGSDHTPAALLALVKNLNKTLRHCGYKSETRPFKPHVTLMRKARPLATLPDFKPVSWNIIGFVLAQSLLQQTGVCYRILKEYKFAC
ncbi:MAG: RNA 2',3'-cyclic phosphodiesterase [Gammaproteobacteria bacterium]|nr:RNA 2',3'-cyclic phosphodiesterase [Gammaproteobacteria bacterium]